MAPTESKLLENLESATGAKQREVAVRLRRLAYALVGEERGTQARFHDLMGGEEGSEVRRTELVTAWGGGSLCKTEKWLRAIAKASGASLEKAAAYVGGEISVDDLLSTRETQIVPDGEKYGRVLQIAAGMTPPASVVDVLRVISELAAYKGSETDEDIAKRLRPAWQTKSAIVGSVVDDDDLGGGLSAVPKLPPRRRK